MQGVKVAAVKPRETFELVSDFRPICLCTLAPAKSEEALPLKW